MVVKGEVQVDRSQAFEGLPEELAEFLSKDTYSLLIKGESGTGKTLLALTILKALQPIENLLYLSTRTSPLQLVENYPWTEEIFGPAVAKAEPGEKEAEGWETLVDARLDEPNVVFERITNVLMDKQAPTVVIDSWESLSDTLGTEALRTNIRVLQTWRERAGARFILIGEDPASAAIDFMVEGIVVLKDRLTNSKRLREAMLSKLHGVKISRPSYFFTLQEGMFTSFPSYSSHDYAFKNPLPVRLDKPFRRVKSRFPTGYAPLDGQLNGGYPTKATVLVEVDRRVDMRVGLIFISRTIQEWVAAGENVVMGKIPEVDGRYLGQYVKSFCGGAKGRVFLEEPGKVDRRPENMRGRNRRESDGGRTLAIVGGAPATKGKTAEELRPWGGGTHASLTIILARAGEMDQLTSGKVSAHLRFLDIQGTLFLESELPWSALYGVIPGMTAGNPMIRLEPVV